MWWQSAGAEKQNNCKYAYISSYLAVLICEPLTHWADRWSRTGSQRWILEKQFCREKRVKQQCSERVNAACAWVGLIWLDLA